MLTVATPYDSRLRGPSRAVHNAIGRAREAAWRTSGGRPVRRLRSRSPAYVAVVGPGAGSGIIRFYDQERDSPRHTADWATMGHDRCPRNPGVLNLGCNARWPRRRSALRRIRCQLDIP